MANEDISLEVDTRAVEKALLALPGKLAGRIMTDALQAAGEVMAEAMVAHAPERTDDETPGGNSLPPGILKADIQIQVQTGTKYAPRVKVGPGTISGHVGRWQEEGWMLTGHGKSHSGKKIKAIPGKHYMAAAFDESSDQAVQVLLGRLTDALFATEGSAPEDDYGGENY